MPTETKADPTSAYKWIRELDDRLWPGTGSHRISSQVRMTQKEWTQLLALIKRHELPCTLGHTAYGFMFLVHEAGVVQNIQPETILQVGGNQFPFPSARRGFSGQVATLKVLKQVTHSRRNQELLAWSGFHPLSPPHSYAY